LSSRSVVAVGLPNAGKSTFIAALTYVLKNQEVTTQLRFKKLPEEMTYLTALVNDWLDCVPFERTKHALHRLEFSLQTADNAVGVITFPDISGETFEQHWALREWEPDFAKLAETANGVLLFLNPKSSEKPFSIVAQKKIEAVLDLSDGMIDSPESDASASHTNDKDEVGSRLNEKQGAVIWDPKKATSQVKLADILQMLANRASNLPLRVGVIVSAWDIIKEKEPAAQPDHWLADYVPFLDGFLKMNPEMFVTRIYGVSAQGGDNERDGEKLRALDMPTLRIKVQGQDCGEHDITAPLKWVLRLDA